MDFPIFINWMSSFPILGLSGDIFHLYSNCNIGSTFCKKNTGDHENAAAAASDLGLHCFRLLSRDRLTLNTTYLNYFMAPLEI